jgi:hypothetical protein
VNQRKRRNSSSIPLPEQGRTGIVLGRDYFSLYCYPWDVLDKGVKAFAQLSKNLGLTNISLASTYHGGKALLPHNSSQRVYYVEDGAIYFRPSARFFKGTTMQPRVSRLAAQRDVFGDIVEACGKQGVQTTAWTVALHNTYLGTEYPQFTTQNVFGDRYFHSLCPAQPEVMAYMRALVRNLANYPIDAVEFESFEFIPFRHYSFLEKEGIAVTPFAALLLSLCFCPACVSSAQKNRINPRLVAKSVKLWLEKYFAGERRRPSPIETEMVTVPGLPEFLEMRFNILAEGFKEMAGLLHAANKRVISIVAGQEVRRDFITGVDIEKVCGDADALETLFYLRKPREAAGLINALRRAAGGDPNLYFAVRPGYPDAESLEDVVRMAKSVLDAGGKGVSFYNFGLLEEWRLAWIGKTISKLSRGGKPSKTSPRLGRIAPKRKTQLMEPNVLRKSF